MGKKVTNPKRHIVSCRVNEEEMELLMDLARKSNVSISTLVRRSILVIEEATSRPARAHA
ncbi:MAG: hydrogen-dependent growth transcriptional repressor [Desulfuromonas sp.]|uniref:plasmid mobilization protein n=1 Tax=Desulfuromonas sp. TaxID=892 RepID=UPI000CBFA45D|nr:hydrogen-dependent growth transcriptional repressor [Desulfuromonas sp.]PLX83387.1 MAG: hydrogen-dependent growth transcriptional repressor [Desulfuromonas sp.]